MEQGCEHMEQPRRGESPTLWATGECKRYSRASTAQIADWWVQAVTQARDVRALPALFYRLDRGDWRAVWPAGIHLPYRPVPVEFDDTLTADPATWWEMVRHVGR